MIIKPPLNLELNDRSSIAVIGGGPSGSFFSYFALDFAKRLDLDIKLDIYEPKNFTKPGAGGCNHCGGIVSESLVQKLSTDGIVLPSNIIRRGIETYTLHIEQGNTIIKTPKEEQRIASVYRGAGPKGCMNNSQESFDNHLLELCKKNGATIIQDKIIEGQRVEDGIILRSKKIGEKKYDLVVGAAGLNNKTLEIFKSICPKFVPPKVTRTYISEFLLERDEIDKHIVANFIEAEQVKGCFPKDLHLKDAAPCKCYPYINVKAARNPFADNVVLIGDTASSKLYKNGIGAAYTTGRAAARTAIFEGISRKSFKKYYYPVCRNLDLDNNVGKFIFFVTKIIQKSKVLKKGLFKMVVNEQKKQADKRLMSSVLWDTFTGSAGYQNIFIRFLNPLLIFPFLWNIVTANLSPKKL